MIVPLVRHEICSYLKKNIVSARSVRLSSQQCSLNATRVCWRSSRHSCAYGMQQYKPFWIERGRLELIRFSLPSVPLIESISQPPPHLSIEDSQKKTLCGNGEGLELVTDILLLSMSSLTGDIRSPYFFYKHQWDRKWGHRQELKTNILLQSKENKMD